MADPKKDKPAGEKKPRKKAATTALRAEIKKVANDLDLPVGFVTRKVRARTKAIDEQAKKYRDEQMASVNGHVAEIVAESFRTASTNPASPAASPAGVAKG